jgi:hypothetical protein
MTGSTGKSKQAGLRTKNSDLLRGIKAIQQFFEIIQTDSIKNSSLE